MTHEQAIRAAQGNLLAIALSDVLSLSGWENTHAEQMAVVFTATTVGHELVGVWSFEGGQAMDDLTTIGLLHRGTDLILHPTTGPDEKGGE